MSDEPTQQTVGNGQIDWAEAVMRHRRWLGAVVYARLGDSHAVDEVLQDIVLAAIERPPVLNDPANLTAWLYRAAVLAALNRRRKLGRLKRRIDRAADATNGHTSAADNPLNWLLADEERQLVRTAIERLRSKDRELLLLKYTEHWSCRELADRLGIRVSAVENRLDRARQRLRKELTRLNIQGDHQ